MDQKLRQLEENYRASGDVDDLMAWAEATYSVGLLIPMEDYLNLPYHLAIRLDKTEAREYFQYILNYGRRLFRGSSWWTAIGSSPFRIVWTHLRKSEAADYTKKTLGVWVWFETPTGKKPVYLQEWWDERGGPNGCAFTDLSDLLRLRESAGLLIQILETLESNAPIEEIWEMFPPQYRGIENLRKILTENPEIRRNPDDRLREIERQAQISKNLRDVFAYYRELDRLGLRRAIPVSWLGPSSRKSHNIRVHGNAQVAGWIGAPINYGGRAVSPVNLWGKITKRYPSSLIVNVPIPGSIVEIQATKIYLWEIPIPTWIRDLKIT